jgi:hypothetical protein
MHDARCARAVAERSIRKIKSQELISHSSTSPRPPYTHLYRILPLKLAEAPGWKAPFLTAGCSTYSVTDVHDIWAYACCSTGSELSELLWCDAVTWHHAHLPTWHILRQLACRLSEQDMRKPLIWHRHIIPKPPEQGPCLWLADIDPHLWQDTRSSIHVSVLPGVISLLVPVI